MLYYYSRRTLVTVGSAVIAVIVVALLVFSVFEGNANPGVPGTTSSHLNTDPVASKTITARVTKTVLPTTHAVKPTSGALALNLARGIAFTAIESSRGTPDGLSSAKLHTTAIMFRGVTIDSDTVHAGKGLLTLDVKIGSATYRECVSFTAAPIPTAGAC